MTDLENTDSNDGLCGQKFRMNECQALFMAFLFVTIGFWMGFGVAKALFSPDEQEVFSSAD